MAVGAWAVSSAEAPDSERSAWKKAIDRECFRYGLKRDRLIASLEGAPEHDPLEDNRPRRSWWDLAVLVGAIAVFVWLAVAARPQPVTVNRIWMAILIVASLAFLFGGGLLLWRRTRFS